MSNFIDASQNQYQFIVSSVFVEKLKILFDSHKKKNCGPFRIEIWRKLCLQLGNALGFTGWNGIQIEEKIAMYKDRILSS